jgi:hypothetical protein
MERNFFQELIKNIPFRSFSELISSLNLTKHFKKNALLEINGLVKKKNWE